MRNSHKLNQFSTDSLDRNDLQFDEFKHDDHKFKDIDQIESPSPPMGKSSNRHSFFNPFISTNNHQPSQQQQFNFQNLSSKKFTPHHEQQQPRQSRSSSSPFHNKYNSDFPRNSKPDKIKQSSQFMFNGDGSGSLFSSQKSQNDNNIDNKGDGYVDKYKNLETYRKLLKQHYNDSYMRSTFQLIKRSTLGKSIRGSDPSNFITRQPILFHKKFYGSRSGYDLSGNYLCRLIGNKIYYKNVVSEELQLEAGNSDNGVKCMFMELPVGEQASPSIEVDSNTQHLFYYSNTYSQLVVISLSPKIPTHNQICRIKVRTPRTNPLLYLVQINKQTILLLIGGHTLINPKNNLCDVEGCKYIEIFPIDEWGTGIMQSRVIRLINGKIYPLIIFPIKIENADSLLLIGGNAMGRVVGEGGRLSFKEHKVLNRSSNFRAVYISTKQIIQCIQQGKDIMSLPNLNNISVQIQDKVNLYKGYVDYVRSSYKQRIRIFLPKMKQFYTLKILKKQLRIIRSNDSQQRLLTFDSNQEYHHLEMKCFKQPMMKYYQINSKGIFQQKIIGLSNSSFRLKEKCRCPCEFM